MSGRRAGLAAWVGVGLAVAGLRADEPAGPTGGLPPWQRVLKGEDARKAAELRERIKKSCAAGDLTDALRAAEALRELRAAAQGRDHWEAVYARWEVDAFRRVLTQPA